MRSYTKDNPVQLNKELASQLQRKTKKTERHVGGGSRGTLQKMKKPPAVLRVKQKQRAFQAFLMNSPDGLSAIKADNAD